MTTIKLTPTQKRLILSRIVKHLIGYGKDILPYIGRNLGDFNYETLYNEFKAKAIFNREIMDLFTDAKYDKIETKTTGSKKYSKLTEMETQVFDFLLCELETWIGCEDYTPIDTLEIQQGTGIESKKLRGVLSSLKQKEIIQSYEHDTNNDFYKRSTKKDLIELWYFIDQTESTTEELIAKVK